MKEDNFRKTCDNTGHTGHFNTIELAILGRAYFLNFHKPVLKNTCCRKFAVQRSLDWLYTALAVSGGPKWDKSGTRSASVHFGSTSLLQTKTLVHLLLTTSSLVTFLCLTVCKKIQLCEHIEYFKCASLNYLKSKITTPGNSQNYQLLKIANQQNSKH